MKEHIAFPSIEQFRHVIKVVTDRVRYNGKNEDGSPIYVNRPLPVLKFKGTVKLHGTNAGVRLQGEELVFQSRERDLTLLADNAGFCTWGMSKADILHEMFECIEPVDGGYVTGYTPVIYGEWCGGNIQKGVALCELPKMFVIFNICLHTEEGRVWLPLELIKDSMDSDILRQNSIYFIDDFPTYELEVDFENPHLAQNEIVKLVDQVENECPVGKTLGVSGIGEGLVWSHDSELGHFVFKTKGEKHSATKVKTVAAVDVEKINSIKEFVASVVTESRLNQGLEKLREQQLEPVPQNVGAFIKWVNGDVFKEESDTIVANGLDAKMVSKEVTNAARKWYFEQL